MKPAALKSLSAKIDALFNLRAKRLEAQRAVDKQKDEEDALNAEVLDALRAAKLDGAKAEVAVAAIRRLPVATVTDEAAFMAWAVKAPNRDCLKVGIVGEAWRERHAAGVKVPGVESYVKETLTVSPRGK
jgi:hypothetical protein